MSSTDYPDLEQFLGCHFHQDWDLDFDNWVAGVSQFLSNWPPQFVLAVRKELNRLLARGLEDQELGRLLLCELGCYYDPTPDGISYTEWLCQIRDQLEKADFGETSCE